MSTASPIRRASTLSPGVVKTLLAKVRPANLAVTKANVARVDQPMFHSMDETSFRALYERMSRPLWAYLCHASGNAATADDLVQDSFCHFLASTPPLMTDAQTKSYLYRIATNLLRDRWRR